MRLRIPYYRVTRSEQKQILKIAIASGLAWWLGVLIGGDAHPIWAAVVPIVSIGIDPLSSRNAMLARLIGVFFGVGLGLVAEELLSPGPIEVAVVVAIALAVGTQVRLPGGDFNRQVAVSALLMLFLGQAAGGSGPARVLETAVGGAVSILIAIVIWPPDPVASIADRIQRVREQLRSDMLSTVRLLGTHEDALRLVTKLREHTVATARLADELDRASRSVRWNPYRLRKGLRTRLDVLDERMRMLIRLERSAFLVARDFADDGDDEHLAPDWGAAANAELERAATALLDASDDVLADRDPSARIAAAQESLDAFLANEHDQARALAAGELRRALNNVERCRRRVAQLRTAAALQAASRDAPPAAA